MGLGSFVNINIFVIKYYFFTLFIFSIFFESLKSKSTQMSRPQKGNSEVSFNDTLLNFGLCTLRDSVHCTLTVSWHLISRYKQEYLRNP